jgi:hypothetical protein
VQLTGENVGVPRIQDHALVLLWPWQSPSFTGSRVAPEQSVEAAQRIGVAQPPASGPHEQGVQEPVPVDSEYQRLGVPLSGQASPGGGVAL